MELQPQEGPILLTLVNPGFLALLHLLPTSGVAKVVIVKTITTQILVQVVSSQ